MRIAVISDIHANLVALERVLAYIDTLAVDALWCLGDVVGYGPEPGACVERIRARATVCLLGNHDAAVVGRLPLEGFNPVARAAILWQREHLSQEHMAWLASLSPRWENPRVTLVHGSPRHPLWEYVDNQRTAAANYEAFTTPLALIGHSHLALAWRLHKNRRVRASLEGSEPGTSMPLDLSDKWLLNPGSVGQPRDRDPRAALAVLDFDALTWTWYRLDYDIEAVEQAILAAGLPQVLGRRLYLGW